ncbi:MAG: serine/threonine-protein kinase, partial [bacterium]
MRALLFFFFDFMPIYPSGTLIANRYEVVQGPREKPSLAGGMGLVYLCVDHAENGRPVALKTFRPELLPDRAARDRFLREGTTWVQMGKHPHIVRCHEVFKADIGPEVFFVLELVAAAEGKRDASLRSWLTSGKPLSVEQALLFALHIARGMKHATAKILELVHRDLKPENLLIGREGLLRVTDFGLATVTRSSTEGGGTLLYMAPEQWDQTNVDLRADIYAFGCILFEMLAGHPAVQPGSIPALKKAHQTGQVRALPADLSIEVTALIRQCMAVRPEARYGTWSEVESVVENTYPAKRGISDKVVTGKNVPIELTRQVELQSEISRFARIERVAMAWSYNAMGVSY